MDFDRRINCWGSWFCVPCVLPIRQLILLLESDIDTSIDLNVKRSSLLELPLGI